MNKRTLWIINIVVLIGISLFIISQTNLPEKLKFQNSDQKALSTPRKPEEKKVKVEKVIVALTEAGFNPDTIKIKRGTRVVWKNQSAKTASVHSDNHPTHQNFAPLNLGEFKTNTNVQLVFEEKGTYKYHNHLNPSQTGTVVVE